MKGFSIKKIAAIAAGAALVGSALAPVVSAAVVRGDVYNDNGTPGVSVVVGSASMPSDGVWAANIAAKIAEKAQVMREVTVTGSTEGAECSVSDLTVDLTVGGTYVSGEGSHTFKEALNSASGEREIDVSDNGIITNSRLSHLFNDSKEVRLNNVRTNTTMRETMGLTLDAKMETHQTNYKDLIAQINAGDFYYQVSFIPSIDLDTNSFTAGSSDSVKMIFLGEEYVLSTAQLAPSNSYLRLVKQQAKQTYQEGQTITGLEGRNLYEGKSLEVVIDAVVQDMIAQGGFSATASLYDEDGTLIDAAKVDAGANLADIFQDENGDEALKSNLFFNEIYIGSTMGIGWVEVTKGTDTLLLHHGKGYPYDSTSSETSFPWEVEINVSGTHNTKIDSIKIYNEKATWETNPGDESYEPLYPSNAGQSLLGREAQMAVFLQGLDEDVQGYGFAKVDFEGFETEEMTPVRFNKNLGNLPSRADAGGLYFLGANEETHYLPYYFQHSASTTNPSFTFDNRTIQVDVNYNSAQNGAAFKVNVADGDYFNGYEVDINSTGLYIDYPNEDNIYEPLGPSFDFKGNTYVVDSNTTSSMVIEAVAGLRYRTSGTPTNPSGVLGNWTGCNELTDETCGWYFLGDGNVFYPGVQLEGNNEVTFDYSLMLHNNSKRIYLMMSAQTFALKDSHSVVFRGTDFDESGSVDSDRPYFYPNIGDINTSYNPNNYMIADFNVIAAGDTGTTVYIDTQDGGNIGPFTNNNLNSAYSFDVKYFGSPEVILTSGTGNTNYYTKAYTDRGAKMWLLDNDAGAEFSLPKDRRNVWITVFGSEVTRELTGGETLTVAVGETATTSTGATVSVSNPDYVVNCGDVEAGECVADPSQYMSPASVSNPMVYLDSDAPSGARVIVGGPVVNSLAAQVVGIADELVAAGDKVLRVEGNGDILVMGYTAQDTANAARDLINAIEAFN